MKYNKKYIIYLAIKLVIVPVFISFFLISLVLNDDEESANLFNGLLGINTSLDLLMYLLFVFIISYALIIIYSFLRYKSITYSFNKNDITIKSGVIFKNQVSVAYNKMHSVTTKRGIILQILGLTSLMIDSGCTVNSHVDEIVIIDKKQVIDELTKKINKEIDEAKGKEVEHNKTNDDEEKVLNYQFTFKKILLKTVFSFPFAFLFIAALFTTIVIFISDVSENPIITVLLGFAFLILYFIIAILVQVIKYYRFRIVLEEDKIILSYGLFTIIKHVISKDRIRGITILEDPVARIVHGCSLSVELVGLESVSSGNDNEHRDGNELIPYAKVSEVNALISEICGEYKLENIEEKSPKDSYKFFFSIPLIAISIIGLTGLLIVLILYLLNEVAIQFILLPLGITAFLLIIVFILAYIKMKNQGVYYNKDKICFSKGILFRKTFIVLWDNVISLGYVTTPFRMKKKIVSIYIDYYNSSFKNRELVSMIRESTYIEMMKMLKRFKS